MTEKSRDTIRLKNLRQTYKLNDAQKQAIIDIYVEHRRGIDGLTVEEFIASAFPILGTRNADNTGCAFGVESCGMMIVIEPDGDRHT